MPRPRLFTADQVRELRAEYERTKDVWGVWVRLEKRWGVAKSTLMKIIRRESYKDVV